MTRVGWTQKKCSAGHTHRSSPNRLAKDAVQECEQRILKLMQKYAISYDSVCEKCVRGLLVGKPLEARTCPMCGDKTCKDFFPNNRQACYACVA